MPDPSASTPDPSQRAPGAPFNDVIDSAEALRALIGQPVQLVLDHQLDQLDAHARRFIARAPFLVIGTAGADFVGDVPPRGAPEFIRSDNGPEFIARAVKAWICEKGMKTLDIEPGAPWEKPCSESFNSRFRNEFLNLEVFGSKLEAKVLGGEHREKYNHHRPHSSLGDLTPAELAARCLAPLRPFDFVEAACAEQDSVINPKHQPNLS